MDRKALKTLPGKNFSYQLNDSYMKKYAVGLAVPLNNIETLRIPYNCTLDSITPSIPSQP